jgi:hypothetical protein
MKIPREVRMAARLALTTPMDEDIGPACAWCHEMMTIPFDLDPSPCCNPCAQELLLVLAHYVDDLAMAQRKKSKRSGETTCKTNAPKKSS